MQAETADGQPLSPPSPSVRISAVTDVAELQSLSELFSAVWGTRHEASPMPTEILVALARAGNYVTAVYDAEELVGGGVAFVNPDGRSLHSHIAAVAPGQGDRGLGLALKQHQRRWALDRGIERIIWTFDPLQSRNARFNLVKLGAEVRTYERDYYGPLRDAVNLGEPSDRLVAMWELDAWPVDRDALEPPTDFADVDGEPGPDGAVGIRKVDGVTWVRIPKDIGAIRTSDPTLATAWREFARATIGDSLDAGQYSDHVHVDPNPDPEANSGAWYRICGTRRDAH